MFRVVWKQNETAELYALMVDRRLHECSDYRSRVMVAKRGDHSKSIRLLRLRTRRDLMLDMGSVGVLGAVTLSGHGGSSRIGARSSAPRGTSFWTSLRGELSCVRVGTGGTSGDAPLTEPGRESDILEFLLSRFLGDEKAEKPLEVTGAVCGVMGE